MPFMFLHSSRVIFGKTLIKLSADYECGINDEGLQYASNLQELDASLNKRITTICLLVFFLTDNTFSLAFNKKHSSDATIVGTWISEEDTNWKMVFTSTTCKWYYQNVQTDEYTFVLSN